MADTEKQSDKQDTAALALPLRAINVSNHDGFTLGWCAVDANNRVIGYCMTEAQAKQLVAPFSGAVPECGARDAALDEVLRELALLTNRYMNTVEDYNLHGLWRAREVVEAIKKAAPLAPEPRIHAGAADV